MYSSTPYDLYIPSHSLPSIVSSRGNLPGMADLVLLSREANQNDPTTKTMQHQSAHKLIDFKLPMLGAFKLCQGGVFAYFFSCRLKSPGAILNRVRLSRRVDCRDAIHTRSKSPTGEAPHQEKPLTTRKFKPRNKTAAINAAAK